MRLRNIPGADDALLNSEYCIKNPEEQKGHWQDCFNKVRRFISRLGWEKAVLLWTWSPCTQILTTSVSSVTPAYFYALCRKWSRIRFLILSLSAWTRRCCRGFRQRRSRPYLLKLLRSLAERPPRQETSHFQTIFLPVMTRF